ncbi:MAG: glutamate racemase [Thermoflexales bacterium]|nr:glutamate racemase [Thermoflexales bacterium]MDW8351538.1 glutamate racemase [Anaerolineae bacterium]
MIGVFDSGVGGLSVWREIARLIPDVPLVYLADQAHIPYGGRPLDEVRRLTLRAAEWLIGRDCAVVVIACNTASAAALEALRATFPATPFVGIEPAIKPAALHTQTGVVGVLATPTTLHSRRYADLVARWGRHVRVVEQACPGWVQAVEELPARVVCAGDDGLSRLVGDCVTPLLAQGADTLVLGCTHFPFLRPWIERAIGAWQVAHPDAQAATIIDPAPAVARRVRQVWLDLAVHCGDAPPAREFWTTGSAGQFAHVASALLGYAISACALTL